MYVIKDTLEADQHVWIERNITVLFNKYNVNVMFLLQFIYV